MWLRLSAQYLQNASENKYLLQKQFYEYKFKPEHDVLAHITAIELMATQLEDLGETVSHLQIMTKITSTLPPSFRYFISAWDNIPDDQKTISLLTSRLLKEENTTLTLNHGIRDSTDEAFFATNFPTKSNSTQAFTSRGSFNHPYRNNSGRGGFGRNRGNLNTRSNPPYSTPHNKQRIICNYCGGFDHKLFECRTKKRVEKRQQELAEERGKAHFVQEQSLDQPQANDNEESTQEITEGFSATIIAQTSRNNSTWVADSGATHHMSDQLSYFHNFQSIKEGTRSVTGIGGKELSVLGIGDIHIKTTVNGKNQKTILSGVLYIPDLRTNLFSIVSATSNGAEVRFINNEIIIVKNEMIEITGKRIGTSLYSLDIIALESKLMEQKGNPTTKRI